MVFVDRTDAGRRLAASMSGLRDEDVVVLALPRGGVPVAAQVAGALGAPLDVILVRKLGVPFQPELAMGAIGEGGVMVLNENVIRSSHVTSAELAAIRRTEEAELIRRARVLREGKPQLAIRGRVVVIVDDGMATGATARAACRVARLQGARRVIMAIPVASAEAVEELGREVEVVCVQMVDRLWAIGQWYRDFTQVSEAEVISLLDDVSRQRPAAPASANDDISDTEVEVVAGDVKLPGYLGQPPGSTGLVIFVHGSGSGRHSPRNRFVARALNAAGLATLLFDLLTPAEEESRANVFDIGLLAGRLILASRWATRQSGFASAPFGYFGASTGAAAALWAAADPRVGVAAVVSRGGRPDLAGARLAHVRAPTLLIVGGEDHTVLDLNRLAQDELRCESRLTVVPGAGHLFEEPGALPTVARLAGEWFLPRMAPAESDPSTSRAAGAGPPEWPSRGGHGSL